MCCAVISKLLLLRFTTGVNDTGGKFVTGATGIKDTGDKFATGVIDTGGK